MNWSIRHLNVNAASLVQVYSLSWKSESMPKKKRKENKHTQSGSALDGLATTMPESAPSTSAPSGPIFARTPFNATKYSEEIKSSRFDESVFGINSPAALATFAWVYRTAART